MSKYETIIDPLRERARAASGELVLTFFHEDGRKSRLSAGDLYARAQQFARGLEDSKIDSGDLVILVFHHSIDLVAAFLGTIASGAVPSIFPFLSEKLDPDLYHRRVRTLVEEAGAKALIVSADFKTDLASTLAGVDCAIITHDSIPTKTTGDEITPPTARQEVEPVALLQYSSGSTGLQKGVVLSHRRILNQIEALIERLDIQPSDAMVSWLPLYHDMGLIGGFLLPLVAGVPIVLISPFHWVREPRVLFEAFDAYGGTLCWMPNFAFNHSVRSVRERDLQDLDLGHVRRIINGSEPVRYHSMQMFYERFKAYGLREEALATGYGMAEITLAATVSPLGAPPTVDWIRLQDVQQKELATPASPDDPDAAAFVSSGASLKGAEIRVADDAGKLLPERRIGEIVLKSNSMFTEYYRREELTDAALRDGWFYTSDVGYIAEGELYVLGRKDDMIIVGGRNIYPQDVEEIAHRVQGVYQGRAAAFGIDDENLGTASIVLVCELRGDPDVEERNRIESQLRRGVVAGLDVVLADVRFVERGWIVKTSNGKIARRDNREKYFGTMREPIGRGGLIDRIDR